MTSTPPQLDQHRIDSMRSHVMHAVDEDVSRRGRRARRIGATVLATVLIAGIGGTGISLLSSGSEQRHDAGSSSSAADFGDGRDSSGPESAPTSEQAPEPGEVSDVAPEREVVTTGEIRATVAEPREVAQEFSAWVDSVGGRVDARNEDGGQRTSSARLTVRVPSNKVTAAIDELRRHGEVDTLSLQHEDVTATTTDLEARINALQISVSRLEKILAEASTSEEIVKAERALTERQEQLERLMSQQFALKDRVSLSTLQVRLHSEGIVEPEPPGGFTGGLERGWNSMTSVADDIVSAIGAAVPWAALLVVLSGAALLLRRLRRH